MPSQRESKKKVYQQCDEDNVLSSFSPVMRFSPGLNQIFWMAEKKKQEKYWERVCVVNPTAREESPRGVLWSVKPPHYYQSSRQLSPSLELLHAQMKVQCWRQIEIATVCWTHLRRHHDSTGKNSSTTWWQKWYYKNVYAPSLTTLLISILFSQLCMKDIRDLALFCSSWSDSTTVRDNRGSEAKKRN